MDEQVQALKALAAPVVARCVALHRAPADHIPCAECVAWALEQVG